jgi:uncharacterized protein (TIGR02271 family)
LISRDSVQTIIGQTAFGPGGQKIGSIGQVYLDNATGEPAWATVNTGLFGTNESFVPLSDAQLTGEGLQLPYDKDRVKNAPNVESDRELSEAEESTLYSYYGVADTYSATDTYTDTSVGTDTYTDTSVGTDAAGTVGHDTSGPTTDDAMTRSREEVRAGTEKVEAGRARLRKYVVTEQQQVTVPVTREEVRVEREPITDANVDAALSGPDLSEEEHEVVLTEERAVIAKETVPVERVRLSKETVTDQESVNVDVREERIETDVDGTSTTISGGLDDDRR